MSKAVATRTLAELESVVERGLASFIEVGNALMEIRDGELYRKAGFEGFVEYLESKPWGIGRAQAYNMIETSVVSSTLETDVPQRQARELAPLMRNSTPGVVQQVYAEVVEETGGKPTARAIREKVQSTLQRNGRERPQERPAQYLPDLLDEDSPRNLRTQVVKWCELGRHIDSLLQDRAALEPKSDEDMALIRAEVKAMGQLVKRLEGKVR